MIAPIPERDVHSRARMVDEVLTSPIEAFARKCARIAMALIKPLRVPLCAGALLAAAAPPAHADSPVVIEGVENDTREAILDLLPDRERPDTLFEAERIAEEAASRAMAWLRSEGYYGAQVTPEAEDDPPAARLRIAPGPRFRFSPASLQFIDAPPDSEAAQAARDAIAQVKAGAPARAAAVIDAEADAVARLQAAGYPDAKAEPRRVIVDHATGLASATFNIQSGPFVRLGQARFDPDNVLRPSYARRIRNWEPGEAYSPDKVSRIRQDLSSTGAVSRVTTRLVETDEPGVRDVVLDIEPAKENVYEVGLGWSTTEGAGIDAEWTRRNISGRADALTVGGTLGEKTQGLSVGLVRPHASGLGHAQHFSASVAHEETDAFTRQGFDISASVEAASRLRYGVSYGVSLSGDSYSDSSGVENALVLSGFGEMRRDTTSAPLDARHGSIVTLRAEPAISTGDASLAFLRGIAEARIYRSFGDQDELTLAARGKTGWLQPFTGNADDAPPDRRFYAGGGGSVRGYGYNSIYPLERDDQDLTPGGQGGLEVSGEVRYRFAQKYGVVAFVDGGNAFDDWGEATDLQWSAGLGFRYNLGFGPLRADIAFPINGREQDDDFALYISIGQAF